MSEDYLLGVLFGAVILAVIGYWCRRYPRKAWVVGSELGWFLGSYILAFYLVDTITADGPKWVDGVSRVGSVYERAVVGLFSSFSVVRTLSGGF